MIVDEPEIYLHPDLQRQLIRILRDAGPDIVLATHSSEVISEAEPSDIAIINKRWRSAKQIRDVEGMQDALDVLGSSQNLTLTQLARTRRVLFVEGEDFKYLRRFADRLGLTDLASGLGITSVSIGGFGNWQKVAALGWGIERTLGRPLLLAAVFDRDFFSEQEINAIKAEISQSVSLIHIHECKELENYLLVPAAVDRAIAHAQRQKQRRSGDAPCPVTSAEQLLDEITEPKKQEISGQCIAKYVDYMRRTRSSFDTATLATELMTAFEAKWRSLSTRLKLVPGKTIFAELCSVLKLRYQITLSINAVISELHRDEVAEDLSAFLFKLESFRQQRPPPDPDE